MDLNNAIMKKVCLIFMLFFQLVACTARPIPPTLGATLTPMPTITEEQTAAPQETLETTPAIFAPTSSSTATPDTRLPPERWPEWPIIPSVTGRAIEIYRKGLTMGLDPKAFSKVGDCQSVNAAFMGYLDDPVRIPASIYAAHQKTVDNFKGHFATDGQAVRGGFVAASVLSPLWADPKVCLPGENPLDCELRITRPIIVFVRLERWWDGRRAEQYEILIRRILDDIITHGAVPILVTKADNVEGDNSINMTTAKLAYEYDLPLLNFWAAVQPLPAHGMDTQLNDGFHISHQAWNVASLTGLETLETIWEGLLAAGPSDQPVTPAETPTATPAQGLSIPAETPVPTSIPTAGSTPVGGSNRIVFGVAARQTDGLQYRGVFLLDPADGNTRKLFGDGVQFQSASPDGKYFLISQGSSLYRANVDGAYPLQLTDSLYAWGNRSAVWFADGQIAALLTGHSGGTEIALLSADGSVLNWLPPSEVSPIELYSSVDENHVYWESGSCSAPGTCTRTGARVSGMNGILNGPLSGIQSPAISPDGSVLAYNFSVSNTESDLGLADPGGSGSKQIGLPGHLLTSYAWSPSGDLLAVVLADISDYSGLSSGNRNFVIDPFSQATLEYAPSDLLSPQVLWSPDGSNLFWLGSLPTDNGYKIGAERVERVSKHVTDLSDMVGQSDQNYLLITNAAWLPLP